MSTNSLKYIIYCRKSTETEDRQVLSLSAQKRELHEYSQKHNLNVVGEYTESASAYKLGRVKFNDMLQVIQEGKANAILVWQYNRLARNAIDGGMVIHSLDQGWLKEIKTPTGSTNGSGNSKFMLQLEFAMSKKSSDDNSESVKRGNREKVHRGWDIRKHAGYVFVDDFNTGEKTIEIDKERFPLIQQAMKLVLNGNSAKVAHQTLNEDYGYRSARTRKQGGKPMSISNFYKILKDEFYCGWISYEDIRLRGKHKPMLSEFEFDRIQQILGDKGKPRVTRLDLPYKGILKCGECGCAICPDEKVQCICSECKSKFSSKNTKTCINCNTPISKMESPTHLHYLYYRCTKRKQDIKCSQKTVKVDKLEKQLKNHLGSIKLSPRATEWVLKQLEKDNEITFETHDQILQNLQSELSTIQDDLKSLSKRFTSAKNKNFELLDEEEYLDLKKDLKKQRKRTEKKIADLGAQTDQQMQKAENIFSFARTAVARFNKGDEKVKTNIIRELGANLTILDGKVRIQHDYPWLFIREAKQKLDSLNLETCEPEKMIDLYDKTGVSNPVISTLQGRKESNLRQGFWRPLFYR